MCFPAAFVFLFLNVFACFACGLLCDAIWLVFVCVFCALACVFFLTTLCVGVCVCFFVCGYLCIRFVLYCVRLSSLLLCVCVLSVCAFDHVFVICR